MLEPRRQLNFAPEPFDVDSRRQIRRQHFYDYFATERYLLGDKDARHPTAAELALEHVAIAEGLLQFLSEIWRGGFPERGALM